MASPIHDFLLPRIAALVNEAVGQGMPRDATVAVLIDIVTSPAFDTALPDPHADDPVQPAWERGSDSVPLVGGSAVRQPRRLGERHEADFIRPNTWFNPT